MHPVPWQPGEFTQGLLSCYLLSNENTLLAAKQKQFGDPFDQLWATWNSYDRRAYRGLFVS
jgi:hypothetical protein